MNLHPMRCGGSYGRDILLRFTEKAEVKQKAKLAHP